MLGPFVSMSLSPTDGKDNLTKWILSLSNPITRLCRIWSRSRVNMN